MVSRWPVFTLLLLLQSCATFGPKGTPTDHSYAPAAYGPLMDLDSLKEEKLQRGM